MKADIWIQSYTDRGNTRFAVQHLDGTTVKTLRTGFKTVGTAEDWARRIGRHQIGKLDATIGVPDQELFE